MALNKNGDKRGLKENNKNNFAVNKELQEKAEKAAHSDEANSKGAATSSIQQKLYNNRTKRITPEVQEAIRDKLFSKGKNGHSYITDFVNNFLDTAKKDPNSKAAGYIANVIFNDKLLTNLDSEINKQMEKDRQFLVYRIRETLYDKQQVVFDDKYSSAIECICTRRAGKSELLARLALNDCLKKGHRVLYLNRSFDNAISQMGTPFNKLLETLDIAHTGSVGSGKVEFPEWESFIVFGGYNNRGDIDRYRGEHFSLVLVDEIGHLRNPKALVTEVLEPAQIDYGKEARIIYTGTPPRTRTSYAKELWDNPNITHYKWSFMDNPFIPDREQVIEEVCKKHNCSKDAPFIQREYFGNMEAYDVDAMYIKKYDVIDRLPDVTYTNAWVGVDWGWTDKAAVISVVEHNKTMYIVRTWSEAKKPVSYIANEVKKQYDMLKSLRLAKEPMVICDTNETGAIADLYTQYNISAYGAYKYDKDMALDQLSEWFNIGNIKIIKKDNDPIIEDADNMIWKRNEETDEIMHELADDEYHGNSMFALLYISRQYAFDVLGLVDYNKAAREIMAKYE